MKKTYIIPICEFHNIQLKNCMMITSLPTENDNGDGWAEDQFVRGIFDTEEDEERRYNYWGQRIK